MPCQGSPDEEPKGNSLSSKHASSVYMFVTEEKQLVVDDHVRNDGDILEFNGHNEHEEGIEVVAWGRFSPMLEDHLDDENGLEAIHPGNKSGCHDDVGSLSLLYRESDSTFVAFYRP